MLRKIFEPKIKEDQRKVYTQELHNLYSKDMDMAIKEG
jgi:hypothetical protein